MKDTQAREELQQSHLEIVALQSKVKAIKTQLEQQEITMPNFGYGLFPYSTSKTILGRLEDLEKKMDALVEFFNIEFQEVPATQEKLRVKVK